MSNAPGISRFAQNDIIGNDPSSLSLRGARQGDVAISTKESRRLLRLRLAMTLRGGLRRLGMVSVFLKRSPQEQHHRDFSIAASRLTRNDI